MTVLVLLDHEAGVLKQPSRSAITAAMQLGEVHALVAGVGDAVATAALAAAKIPGVTTVLKAKGAAYAHALAEPLAELLLELAPSYTHMAAAASAIGKNVMPRVAALMDAQLISDIVEIESEDTFVRPIYAGNVLATVRSADAKKILTVRASAFDPAPAEGGSANIADAPSIQLPELTTFISEELSDSKRPELTAARVIVSGGRGMGSAENFQLIDPVADKLGAAVGASRAAVDSGFMPNDYQIGQTGKIVAPELYVAVGISGAIQHLAGMKDSKVIVAINKDPDAPIFQIADYGLVSDLFVALPELKEALEKI